MNEERIIALWTEGYEEATPFLKRERRVYEYKVTVLITYDKVEFREYSRRQGTKEWLPENKTINVPREKLREMLAEKHPMAPDRCPACEWTNNGLMNYGSPGKSRWLCHGCAARLIADREVLP